MSKLYEEANFWQDETAKESKRRLNERHYELNDLINKLYESNASSKLPDKHFERLLAEYDSEQTELEKTLAGLQS